MNIPDSLAGGFGIGGNRWVAPKAVGAAVADKAVVKNPMLLTNQVDAIGPTSDPMWGVNPNPTQPPPQPAAPNLFSGTAAGVGQNYANTLNQSLTGTIYDPMAAGAKEAMARQAANKRAATAGQIASAGFSGTGIGQTVAGATENDLTKQKYDTMIGIEQARNQGRLNALGEARAYGTAEEGIRQYEQNFGQDKMVDERNFNEDVRRYGQDFAENKRRYDEGFAEDKSRYGDTQNWRAYEQALATGSDADVVAAYKAATGKDLDPAAVSQYRGYARTAAEQGIQTNQNSLNSETGKKLAATITGFPDITPENWSGNASVVAALQAQWDTLPGKKGTPMDPTWAAQQVKGIKDSSNAQIVMNRDIEYMVSSGAIDAETGEIMKSFGGNQQFWQSWKKDPATGKYSFDAAAYEKATGVPAGSLGGTDTTSGVPTTIPAGAKTDDIFVGPNGNTYTVEDGKPVELPLSEVSYPVLSYTPGTWQEGKGGKLSAKIGETTKLNTPDGPKALKLTGRTDTGLYEFTAADGTKYRLSIDSDKTGTWQTQQETGGKYRPDGTIDRSNVTLTWKNYPGQRIV